MTLKRELSFFDVTSIIIGAVIGADIYIVPALTAGTIGPLTILAWVIGGIFTIIIALVFSYCSYYVPKVGGPFAFVSAAFDKFYGFLTGWSMWIAEMMALPVFAIVFVQYLGYFIKLEPWEGILIKGLFLFGITYVNIIGVKAAGKLNDVLTILKLSPLFLFIFLGFYFLIQNPSNFMHNYTPLSPLGYSGFGAAIVITFWAYAGFEIGTLPASEMKNPKKNLPKAIIVGVLISIVFYIAVNFVLFGVVNWHDLSKSSVPLAYAGISMIGGIGGLVLGLGALLSVSGANESGTLGIARLSYSMSIHGLFPKIFSKTHSKYKTPYVALLIQGVIAFVLSIYAGLTNLISFAVFNLAFTFFFVCLSLVVLKKESTSLHGQKIIPWCGMAICCFLIYYTTVWDKIIGTIIILLGIPIYVFFSSKIDIIHLKDLFLSEESILAQRLEKKEIFLAHFIGICHRIYKRLLNK